MKISLDRQLANLLVQLADPFPAVSRECVAAKDRGRVLQQLRLPARHLVRMHLVMRRNLGHCLFTPNRLQGHTGLERRRVVTSWLPHGLRSSVHIRARHKIHLYPCPKNRSQLSTGCLSCARVSLRIRTKPHSLLRECRCSELPRSCSEFLDWCHLTRLVAALAQGETGPVGVPGRPPAMADAGGPKRN